MIKQDVNADKIVDSLRAQGYRITKAREDIITILCDKQHYTVDELVKKLKNIKDNVNVATVYNNLNFLVSERIVNEYNFTNKNSVYELNTGIHAHLVCLDCSNLIDIDIPEYETIKNRIEKEKGFVIVDASLEMFGYCQDCDVNNND